MNNDPWAHRSEGMRCATCMWWLEKARKVTEVVAGPGLTMGPDPAEYGMVRVSDDIPERVSEDVAAPKPRLGRCRRHAPTMNGFVPTFETDWCGDHRLDENAL